MIITESTPFFGKKPLHSFALVKEVTTAEIVEAGRQAGVQCVSEYFRAYGNGSNADKSRFPSALREALSEAVLTMTLGGTAPELAASWRRSFVVTFETLTGVHVDE